MGCNPNATQVSDRTLVKLRSGGGEGGGAGEEGDGPYAAAFVRDAFGAARGGHPQRAGAARAY